MRKNPLVLIVDDNKKNLQFIGNLLGDFGYELVFAQSGEQVLDFVKNELPDLILLDVMMPEMDGFEVCSILKQNPQMKDVPIIFLTAKSEMEDILKGFEVGGSDYVTKPFNANELTARVKAHLELKLAREEIKMLKEIVPICSNCKAIKNNKGQWEPIETFIKNKSPLKFSHGLCPNCLKELYPDIADKVFKNLKE